MPSELASDVSVNVKFASFVALTVSAPPPPVIVPLPVQPLTVKVFADAPPVRFATVMLLRPKARLNPPPDADRLLLLRVEFPLAFNTTVFVPPAPSRVSVTPAKLLV